jgi:hypothetical protein
MRNVLGVVELSGRESGFLHVFLYSALFIPRTPKTFNQGHVKTYYKLQIASVEMIEGVPGSGDRLKRGEVI